MGRVKEKKRESKRQSERKKEKERKGEERGIFKFCIHKWVPLINYTTTH